jgi:hypothetical protein
MPMTQTRKVVPQARVEQARLWWLFVIVRHSQQSRGDDR